MYVITQQDVPVCYKFLFLIPKVYTYINKYIDDDGDGNEI